MDRMAADMNHELRNTGTLEILQDLGFEMFDQTEKAFMRFPYGPEP